jgi:hypothetical protein
MLRWPQSPPVLVADASEADRIAAKTAYDAAVDAYDQQVVDFSEALSSYRDAQTDYTQWCDEDAHVAVVLTSSILPQFDSEFMALLLLLRCGIIFASGISPLVTLSLYLSVVRCSPSGDLRSMLFSRVIPVLRSSTLRVQLFGASLTLSALQSVVLALVAGL